MRPGTKARGPGVRARAGEPSRGAGEPSRGAGDIGVAPERGPYDKGRMAPAAATSPTARRLLARLTRQMRTTCERYSLLAPGDRVAVAISGGKDSSALLMALSQLARALPFPIELRALHLDQGQPGYDNTPFVHWLRAGGYPFEVVAEDTYAVVREKVAEGRTYCSLCSRLRRGALYTVLERWDYNKLALGHHRDDALQTFLMNLFFSGKLQAMPASYRTDCGRFEVIRPLIECAESHLEELAQELALPILPCTLCGSQENLQRQAMKVLLSDLEAKHPDVRAVMMNALGNVRPTHLLDQEVQAAWAERGPDIRPDKVGVTRPNQMKVLPVIQSR